MFIFLLEDVFSNENINDLLVSEIVLIIYL